MKIRILLFVVITIALASTARGQTKVSGTLHCNKADPAHSIDVGDHEKHSMAVTRVQCTWTKPFEMAGSQTREGTSVELGETTGDKSNGHGVHWGTMATGDKYFVRYQGTSAGKAGAPPTISGTWTFTGGTGKLKGLTGKGTYKGKGNPDGSATFDVVGDHKLP